MNRRPWRRETWGGRPGRATLGSPRRRDGVRGRYKFEPWAKAYLKHFAGPLSTDVRIVAQLVQGVSS